MERLVTGIRREIILEYPAGGRRLPAPALEKAARQKHAAKKIRFIIIVTSFPDSQF